MLEAQALSIHVATTNSLYDRPDFLASLEAQTNRSYQVLFVDLSASKQTAAQEFEITRPDVVRLRTFRNVGVIRGQNQAIALALSRWPRELWSERFIVLSRPEVVFDQSACESFLRAFTADPSLMIAGPKIFWADTSVQTEGDWVELHHTDQLYAAGVGVTRGRTLSFIGQGSQDTGQFDAGAGVVALSDACVVIRASFIETLLLADGVWLDPRVPVGFAVFDLCSRATRAGSRPRLIPEAKIWFAPQHQTRHKRLQWRELYLPSSTRKELDDVGLRCVHAPWVIGSWLRYRVSRFFHGKFWTERLKLEPGIHEYAATLKFLRRPDRAVPLADRRRWFLS